MIALTIVAIVLVIVGSLLLWFGLVYANMGMAMVGLFLAIVFGITFLTSAAGFVYVSTAPYRAGYQEMLKRTEISGGYDEQLNKEIYDWNVLCNRYGYEQYMIEYKKGE